MADYVALARGFGHRSAHEGVGAAWGVERQLPALWGRVADALARHYKLPDSALGYLRYQGTIAVDVDSLLARKREDLQVQPDDVIVVPTSSAKYFVKRFVGTIISGFSIGPPMR